MKLLAELDQAKTNFFANISHEFRTPLTLILGCVETLRSRNDYVQLQEEFTMIHKNSSRLLKLVNSLLEFTRIAAGKVNPKFVETDLDQFTLDLASSFRSACEKASISLVVKCNLSQIVWIDRDMWEKIVLNLLSNALKYTMDGGKIEILLEKAALKTGFYAQFQISDTGVGIPDHEKPRIFERFHRVESTFFSRF